MNYTPYVTKERKKERKKGKSLSSPPYLFFPNSSICAPWSPLVKIVEALATVNLANRPGHEYWSACAHRPILGGESSEILHTIAPWDLSEFACEKDFDAGGVAKDESSTGLGKERNVTHLFDFFFTANYEVYVGLIINKSLPCSCC